MFNNFNGNKVLIHLSVLAFLLFSFNGLSQYNLCRNFSVKDGLPSSEVYEMLAASNGYLWFSTDMGVSRFNGYEFKNFSTENGLPDNTVYGVYEDSKQNIWFRSISGNLSYFNNATGKICSLPCNKELVSVVKNVIVTSLYIDSRDTIWIGGQDSFILKIGPGRTAGDIKRINLPNSGLYVYEIDKGFIFGGKQPNNYLVSLYKKGILYMTVKNTAGFFEGTRFCVKKLKDKSYYASINNLAFNFNDKALNYLYENKNLIICAIEDENNDMITGTYNGVNRLTKNGYVTDKSFKTLDQKIITSMCKDREKELWICTKGHGIFYIPYLNFKYYTPETGLPESSISCLSITDGNVMSGHLNGNLSIFKEQDIKKIDLINENAGEIDEVTGMLNFNEHLKFIGNTKSIFIYNGRTNGLERVIRDGSKMMIRLDDTTLVSLGFRRLHFYSIKDFHLINTVMLSNYTDHIYKDRFGKLWICSSNGLSTYNEKEGLLYLGEKDTLLASRVVDIKEGFNGLLWMATRGKGVIIKKDKTLITIDQSKGLSGNMCRRLFLDSTNVVWVGTNNGLNKITVESFDPLKYSVTIYNSKSGLLTNEVNYIVKFKNELWLAHNNGISIFDPRHIKDNTTPPPVYITDVLVNEKSISLNTADLKHNENYLTINYNGLSFKDPGNIDYKYKLIGLDTNWIMTNYTSVKFQSLPPAEYLFVVYEKNNDGYWSDLPSVFHFTVHPAWWQTWWFKVFIILVIIGLVIAVFIYRLKIFKKRERLKMIRQTKLSNAELKALRSQMNPHFIFNAINSVQYFITNNDPASSQRYLSKFAKLIRYVVDNSKPVAIPLTKELEALNLYLDLESLRFENKFEYTIHIHDNVDVENSMIPSMLIQPYVENAIWHGLMHKETTGKITITLESKEKALICVIEDNGIGRKKSGEVLKAKKNEFHKSVGMSITRERLDIINRKNNSNLTITITDLEDAAGNALGTKVELNLPFYYFFFILAFV